MGTVKSNSSRKGAGELILVDVNTMEKSLLIFFFRLLERVLVEAELRKTDSVHRPAMLQLSDIRDIAVTFQVKWTDADWRKF